VSAPYGIMLPAGSNPVGTSVTAQQLAAAAQEQITQATMGGWLSQYGQAANVALFMQPGINYAGAYIKSAYWMAVAARLAKSRTLSAYAQGQLAKGVAYATAPGGSLGVAAADVAAIYAAAAQTVAGYAASPAVRPVLGILQGHANADVIAKWQDVRNAERPWDRLLAQLKQGGIILGVGVLGLGSATAYFAYRHFKRTRR
jgi:hypothetical protein